MLQAAPLAQFGSTKGGPYTEGCRAYVMAKNEQYAVFDCDPLVLATMSSWSSTDAQMVA